MAQLVSIGLGESLGFRFKVSKGEGGRGNALSRFCHFSSPGLGFRESRVSGLGLRFSGLGFRF